MRGTALRTRYGFYLTHGALWGEDSTRAHYSTAFLFNVSFTPLVIIPGLALATYLRGTPLSTAVQQSSRGRAGSMETPHTAADREMAPPSSNHSHLSLGAHVSPSVIDSPPAHAAADRSAAASESWESWSSGDVCSQAGGSTSSQEERLAALAAAEASLGAAQAEIGKLTAIIEEALDEDEVAEALKGMRVAPAEYLASRRPVYRKTAAAIVDERRAASQVAEIEQQIRDHCLSPADMLVEVRSLLRKQNAGFEAMRAENDLLQSRVTELEAVVSAIILLPQLSQRPSDFVLTSSELELDAVQGGPTTLLHLAAQKQLYDVAEYTLRIGQTPRAQHKIILLNPPEQCRAPRPLEATPSPLSSFRCVPQNYTMCRAHAQAHTSIQLQTARRLSSARRGGSRTSAQTDKGNMPITVGSRSTPGERCT